MYIKGNILKSKPLYRNNAKMYLLGVLYLVVATAAVPVIPDAPTLPDRGVVLVESSILRMDEPKVVKLIEMEHEEKKDENEAMRAFPDAPILPPLDVSILENIKKIDDKKSDESFEPAVENLEAPKEDPKVEEPKKDDDKKKEIVKDDGVEVKIQDIIKDEKPVIIQWRIPSPPFFSSFVSTIPKFPLPMPKLNWPYQIPTVINPPRIKYPGYVIEEQLL